MTTKAQTKVAGPSKANNPLPLCSLEGVLEAGCDEAGRGCLAGPVMAAAVILDPEKPIPGLDDSKKLSEQRRMALQAEIKENALAWCVAEVSAEEIDRINILAASVEAMHRALGGLSITPEAIAVDGNYFRPWRNIPYHTYVKGDGRFANIAAASILAKCARDEYMVKMHEQYPDYQWDSNKGYPTKAHRAAIAAIGPSPIHRMTFRLLESPSLDFENGY